MWPKGFESTSLTAGRFRSPALRSSVSLRPRQPQPLEWSIATYSARLKGLRSGFSWLYPADLYARRVLPAPGQLDRTDAAFWRRDYAAPAYHRFDYGYDAERAIDPVGTFFFEIRSEIDLYYQMNELAREQLHGWADISDAVTNLTTIERKRGRWAAASQALRPRRLTRDASISLTEFAARRQMTNAAVDRQLRQTYSGGTQRFAQELLDGEAGDRQDYPIEQFSQLLNMFEAGHVLEMQLLVAFAASLIGAAIGAGATLLAAG